MSNINPKSLKGRDLLNKTLSLMDKLNPINESVGSNANLEYVKMAPDGTVYGIIKEYHRYFIKTTGNPEFLISDFNYIGGVQNKMDESYSSYEDALKHLNIRFRDLNEIHGITSGTNLFESDEYDMDMDEMKYKLKLNKEKSLSEPSDDYTPPNPSPSPSVDDTTEVPEISDTPDDDFGGDTGEEGADEFSDDSGEEEEFDDVAAEIDDEEDPKRYIQRLTGKLGQKMREMEEVDVKLEKYVINSILSAMHLDKMDKKDKISIMKKFKSKKGGDSMLSESMEYDFQRIPRENSDYDENMSDPEHELDMLNDPSLDVNSDEGMYNSFDDSKAPSSPWKKRNYTSDTDDTVFDDDFNEPLEDFDPSEKSWEDDDLDEVGKNDWNDDDIDFDDLSDDDEDDFEIDPEDKHWKDMATSAERFSHEDSFFEDDYDLDEFDIKFHKNDVITGDDDSDGYPDVVDSEKEVLPAKPKTKEPILPKKPSPFLPDKKPAVQPQPKMGSDQK